MPNEQNMYVYVNREVDCVNEEEFKMFNGQIVYLIMGTCSFCKGGFPWAEKRTILRRGMDHQRKSELANLSDMLKISSHIKLLCMMQDNLTLTRLSNSESQKGLTN